MPKRFTDSEKWKDPWFRKLTPAAKLMCLYLYDRCDIAGFWEIDLEAAAFEIGIKYNDVLGAMKDLERAYETNGDYIWIKRFVRFQGNKDLNENNKAHLGIIRILTEKEGFSKNVSRVLNRQELPSSFEGPSKGLFSPTSISKGKGKGKGKGKANDYSSDFEEFWTIFKDLHRAEGKPLAYDHWNATLKGRDGATGHPPIPASAIIIAAMNYRDYCVANHTERQYVMQPASFVGPQKRGWAGYRESVETGTQERDARLLAWMEEEK